jgi:hypothetical protein
MRHTIKKERKKKKTKKVSYSECEQFLQRNQGVKRPARKARQGLLLLSCNRKKEVMERKEGRKKNKTQPLETKR